MLKTLDVSDGVGLSAKIPRHLRVLIADAVIAFSHLEHAMAVAVWSYLNLSPLEGKIFTDIGFNAKKKLTRRLLREGHDGREYDAATSHIWPMLDNIAFDRNVLAHGRLFHYQGRCLVGILDRPNDDPTVDTGRIFNRSRLTELSLIADHLAAYFNGLAEVYSTPDIRTLTQVEDRSKTGLIALRERILRGSHCAKGISGQSDG